MLTRPELAAALDELKFTETYCILENVAEQQEVTAFVVKMVEEIKNCEAGLSLFGAHTAYIDINGLAQFFIDTMVVFIKSHAELFKASRFQHPDYLRLKTFVENVVCNSDGERPVFVDMIEFVIPRNPVLLVGTESTGDYILRFYEERNAMALRTHPVTAKPIRENHLCKDPTVLSYAVEMRDVCDEFIAYDLFEKSATDFLKDIASYRERIHSIWEGFHSIVAASQQVVHNALLVIPTFNEEAFTEGGAIEAAGLLADTNAHLGTAAADLGFPLNMASLTNRSNETVKKIEEIKEAYDKKIDEHRYEKLTQQLQTITCPLTGKIPQKPILVVTATIEEVKVETMSRDAYFGRDNDANYIATHGVEGISIHHIEIIKDIYHQNQPECYLTCLKLLNKHLEERKGSYRLLHQGYLAVFDKVCLYIKKQMSDSLSVCSSNETAQIRHDEIRQALTDLRMNLSKTKGLSETESLVNAANQKAHALAREFADLCKQIETERKKELAEFEKLREETFSEVEKLYKSKAFTEYDQKKYDDSFRAFTKGMNLATEKDHILHLKELFMKVTKECMKDYEKNLNVFIEDCEEMITRILSDIDTNRRKAFIERIKTAMNGQLEGRLVAIREFSRKLAEALKTIINIEYQFCISLKKLGMDAKIELPRFEILIDRMNDAFSALTAFNEGEENTNSLNKLFETAQSELQKIKLRHHLCLTNDAWLKLQTKIPDGIKHLIEVVAPHSYYDHEEEDYIFGLGSNLQDAVEAALKTGKVKSHLPFFSKEKPIDEKILYATWEELQEMDFSSTSRPNSLQLN